jgi:hypothetical protein
MTIGRTAEITPSQAFALLWLRERNGDGVFDKHGVLLAGGELAPVMRGTWNALRRAGLVEFYNLACKGRGRCRVTAAGAAIPDLDLGRKARRQYPSRK